MHANVHTATRQWLGWQGDPDAALGYVGKQCSPFTQTDNKLKRSRTRILLSKPIPGPGWEQDRVLCVNVQKCCKCNTASISGPDVHLTGLELSMGLNASLSLKDFSESCGKVHIWIRLSPAAGYLWRKIAMCSDLALTLESTIFSAWPSASHWLFAIKSCLQWTFSYLQ